MSTDREQDIKLMTAVEEYINDALIDQSWVTAVVRDHDRKLTVAFPDGRIVTLVLYGPRGS